ncbi:hypothetical protein [Elizabethkingia anophelis]|uniref:hypothetical protein n=1 Tax=Elizabethkingia anophelis TaxID=1117645 RepID=UPI0038929C27
MEGKANEMFLDWITSKYFFKDKKYSDLNIYQKGDIGEFLRFTITKHAYILEWLDSVGIYIFTKRLTMLLEFKEWYFIITNSDGVHLNNHVSQESRILKDSRQEATEAAIKKAVEIYNEKYA